ncbi:DUF3757 domain-containing protein [Pseudomonas sp. NPDC088368]|jgi:hypothetical protein|uniref:DUF3757 domain-containing protein n=1 Tax=Pseudomonas sp. NPDC088368 TaxID=3364453 RepID=UPI0038062FF1
MKYQYVCAALMMSLSGVSIAAVNESCPGSIDIQHTAGIFTAPTASGKGEWVGVLSTPDPKPIKRFEMATVYSGKNESNGTFGKCAYMTEGGERIDLRYRPGESSEIAVQLENTSAWKRTEGPFGVVIYQCDSPEKNACAFSELK